MFYCLKWRNQKRSTEQQFCESEFFKGIFEIPGPFETAGPILSFLLYNEGVFDIK